MKRTVSLRGGLLIVTLLGALVTIGFGFQPWTKERKVRALLRQADRIQVWAGGMRKGEDGSLCPCSGIAPTLILDSRLPGDLEVAQECIDFQWHQDLTLVKACGDLTMDVLQGDRRLTSLHFAGDLLRSPVAAPLDGSAAAILRNWRAQRGIDAGIEAARKRLPR